MYIVVIKIQLQSPHGYLEIMDGKYSLPPALAHYLWKLICGDQSDQWNKSEYQVRIHMGQWVESDSSQVGPWSDPIAGLPPCTKLTWWYIHLTRSHNNNTIWCPNQLSYKDIHKKIVLTPDKTWFIATFNSALFIILLFLLWRPHRLYEVNPSMSILDFTVRRVCFNHHPLNRDTFNNFEIFRCL